MHFKLGGVPCTYSGHLKPTLAPGSREGRSSLLSTHLGSLITEFTMEAAFIVLVSSFMHTLKILQWCVVWILFWRLSSIHWSINHLKSVRVSKTHQVLCEVLDTRVKETWALTSRSSLLRAGLLDMAKSSQPSCFINKTFLEHRHTTISYYK